MNPLGTNLPNSASTQSKRKAADSKVELALILDCHWWVPETIAVKHAFNELGNNYIVQYNN